MSASEHFKAGRLQAAIDAQLQEVRAKPGDMNQRLFLFELAAFSGDLDRAAKQLDLLTFDTPELQAAVALYRNALESEKARRALFAQGQTPQFFQTPPEHVTHRLAGLAELRGGRSAEGARLIQQANDTAPVLKGTFNDKPFEGLRDGDDLFGPVLEVFSQGRYFWAPLEQLASVAMHAPKFPRDLLWVPARIMLKDGNQGDVLIPAIYAGSHEHADESMKLGRASDWVTPAEGLVRGVGARTYLVGDDAASLLDWREVLIAG